MAEACYHCGLPVAAQTDYVVTIAGQARRMCCAGCQAVAQAIVGNGLADYYTHRDALPESPREALPQALQDLGLFDHPEVQKSFVQRGTDRDDDDAAEQREAALILEGITCAACVWLNEQHLARQPGVVGVDINYATRRARVRWDERQIKLSQIIAAIAAIGYRAYPYDPARSEQLAERERRAALWRLFVAGFGMMQVMMYAVPVYLAEAGSMSADIEQLMRWASLILTLPVMLYSAAPFFLAAWRDLRLRRVGMDLPVALGVGSAFVASVWATLTAGGAVYFDSLTMFVFLLLGGRYLEMMGRQKAARGIEALARALPAVALRLDAYPALDEVRVAVADLRAGDIVRVRPGAAVVADGCVLDGASEVDEALLTGESLPVVKAPGDALTAGSINIGSPLLLRVERVGEATRLAAIRRLVERAATEKPRLVSLADRIAARFVAVLLLLALGTAAFWYVADPGRALWVFVAVLVVSCPCALSLATPAALAVATGALARLGVLVTRAQAIETLALVDHFVFDKTGTLTRGRLTLRETLLLGEYGEAEVLARAAALESGSEHPVGRALRAAAATAVNVLPQEQHATTGRGMEARLEGERLRIGTLEFVAEMHGRPLPETARVWSEGGGSVVALGNGTGWLALLRFSDQLRPGAQALLDELRRAGLRVSILSGDSAAAVRGIAAQLGVSDAHGELSPEAKHAHIAALQRCGAVVAMVGDGVNDAPVLAQAQLSIAMGGGTDLARQQADIVLMGEDLGKLGDGLLLARRTLAVVRQNLVWAFAYNLLAIPLAMAGLVTPWLAGIGMSASSLLVVLNALRLQKRKD